MPGHPGERSAQLEVPVPTLDRHAAGAQVQSGMGAITTALAWNFVGTNAFLPLMKGVAGLFVDRQKSLSITAWYQSPLTDAAEAAFFKNEIGLGLASSFDC